MVACISLDGRVNIDRHALPSIFSLGTVIAVLLALAG